MYICPEGKINGIAIIGVLFFHATKNDSKQWYFLFSFVAKAFRTVIIRQDLNLQIRLSLGRSRVLNKMTEKILDVKKNYDDSAVEIRPNCILCYTRPSVIDKKNLKKKTT